ncbi:MAG: hypothetical protein LIO93_00735 [Bacteroidales bacterium]|nr:hypothetical protein [Bacteroidales bacterium]
MNVNKEYIASLIGKYFEGLTSLDEEQVLKEYFRKEDIPEEWKDYKPIFMFFDRNSAKDSLKRDNTSIYQEPVNRRKKIKPLMKWMSISVAACVAILISFHFFLSPANKFPEKSQAFIDGKKYTELSIIQMEVIKSLENMEESNEGIYSSQIEALDLIFE